MAGGILRGVLPYQIKIVAAAAHKHLKFAGDHGQHLEEVLRRLHRGINHDLLREGNRPGLFEERKGKAGGDPQALLGIEAATLELEFDIRRGCALAPHHGEVHRALEYRGRAERFGYRFPLPIGQAQPLLPGRTLARPGKNRALPSVTGLACRGFQRHDAHRERRRPPAPVGQRKPRHDGIPGEDVRRQ